MKQGTIILNSQIGKWLILVALVAALAALLTASVVRAQDDSMTVEHAENDEGVVAMFTAEDPEGATPIAWFIAPATGDPDGEDGPLVEADAVDAGDFDIDEKTGDLTFAIGADDGPPDYENPSGAGGTTSNTYMVVVGACDVALDADACPATGEAGYHKVTVKVTQVDEPGKVTLATNTTNGTPQYLVGATLTATASDGDITDADQTFTADRADEVNGVAWRWYRGGTEITGEDAQDNTYTPTADDVGQHIRAVVYYVVDGNTRQEMAEKTTDYPVLAGRVGANQLEFDPATVSMAISEGDKGRNVGSPVTATGNHGTVRYSLDDTSGDALAAGPKFKIDEKTGRITTEVELNYEALAGAADNCEARNACEVTVTARDSTGDAATNTAVVTIMITDVDEKPDFTTGTQTVGVPENSKDLFGDLADDYTVAAATGDDGVTYTAMDPEGRTVNYSLAGPDASKFQLNGSPPVLSFASEPDFEAKASADGDNVYEVTVRASAGGDTGERMVRVTVSNVDERPEIIQGGLAISGSSSMTVPENSTAAVATFTAKGPMKDRASWTLEGADRMYFSVGTGRGAMTELSFRNAPDYEMPRGMAMSDTNTNTYMVTLKANDGTDMDTHDVTVMVNNMEEDGSVTLMPMAPVVGTAVTANLTDPDTVTEDTVTWQWSKSMTMDGTFMDIVRATMMSYTPVEDDDGYYLRATATYTDGYDSGNMAMDETTSAVVSNSTPVFVDGAMTTREVPENSAEGMDVGAPVTATDADNDTLTYALSGMDAMYFDLDSNTGQITVGMGTMLNHETKDSYSVMVTATDGDMAMATIYVTINVTDVDEMGMVSLSSMDAVVGTELTAMLSEEDAVVGEVEWQWSRSRTEGGPFTHIDEETMSYTPTDDDVGYYLQVAATYNDGHGDKTLEATTGMVRTALMVKYDINKNGRIDRSEAIAALRDYRAGEISRSDAITVLRLYRSN